MWIFKKELSDKIDEALKQINDIKAEFENEKKTYEKSEIADINLTIEDIRHIKYGLSQCRAFLRARNYGCSRDFYFERALNKINEYLEYR